MTKIRSCQASNVRNMPMHLRGREEEVGDQAKLPKYVDAKWGVLMF